MEGEATNVKSFVRELKSWPWASMETRIIEDFEDASSKRFGKFEMTGSDAGKKNDLKLVRDVLREAGLERQFQILIGQAREQ